MENPPDGYEIKQNLRTEGPGGGLVREKGVEPSLTGNWCLKPARLPFRHSRKIDGSYSLAILPQKVNCRGKDL